MCDNCTDFVNLLESFADRIVSSNEDITDEEEEESHDDGDVKDLDKYYKPSKVLLKDEVERLFNFIHSWFQRQCICCFRDGANYERFSSLTRNLIRLVIKQLYVFKYQSNHTKDNEIPPVFLNKNCWVADSSEPTISKSEGRWTFKELETLFHLIAKVFLVNYPLYLPFKQPIHMKGGDMGRDGFFSQYCDLTEQDVSAYLLQNVDLFCRLDGVQLIADCFDFQDLPIIIAHSLITIVCNLKMWLNVRSIITMFIPLRSKVLRYMCNMSDKDLRTHTIKLISDYMWSAVKDPMDTPVTFDKDGLDLAFKYFTSSTLTMRLAGIAQINSHITTFNDVCNSENMLEVEGIGQSLANWLTDNKIITHIFGPNLHVEIIKQSHIILNFLAMESKITNDDIDIIWQAAQLKHCSKQVFDLLAPLIKNLEPAPVTHLYHLLYKMEPKDHTEQSLLLASSINKFIWSSGSTYNNLLDEAQTHSKLMKMKAPVTSGSDNSGLGDAENSDVDSSSDGDDIHEDTAPCKKMKLAAYAWHKKKSCKMHPNENVKVECVLDDSQEDGKKESKKLPSQNDSPNKENIKSNESLKRQRTASQEDVKTSHEEKKQKPIKEDLQISKPKVPIMRCSGSKLDHSEDEDVDVDDEDVDDDDDDEDNIDDDEDDDEDEEGDNELTESDEEVHSIHHHHSQRLHHSSSHQHHHEHHHSLKKSLTEPSIPNILLNEIMEETMSGEDCSVSSRMSTKSEKNMADFDGEDSVCDEELMQLAAHAHAQANLTPQQLTHIAFHARLPVNKNLIATSIQDYSSMLPHFNLENVCKPGSTLLWDLVQDDKICQLAENMAYEAEKILIGLVCYNTDRAIKMKFIEGCLENVQKNRSVVISLRLLPKIFVSFHQGRGNVTNDVNQITLWAFQKHSMMERVFANLITYMKERSPGDIHSHLTHVQVRLQFLSHVFSPSGLPESIRLMIAELDTLWQCLARDPETSDDFFSWLLRQVKCKEQHALDSETLKYLYTKLMPSLAPEDMTMVALSLLQQLCNMSRTRESPMKQNSDALAMELLWKIALRANNTDVSLAAMQYINNYYMCRQLEQEPEFISQCMENLSAASKELHSGEESTLLCIQRALLLLKTHLETFKRRYAYHLRRWALEGQGISSHVISWELGAVPLHIIVHAAGMTDKVTLDMSSTDYIADLRAEVAKWWEAMTIKRCQANDELPRNAVKPIMIPDGQLRMITQGQELLIDYDEKTLAEMGFKDTQIVYVSVGASRMKKKGEGMETPSLLPPPKREHIPTLLLLLPEYFETLFKLMHTLSTIPGKTGQQHHTRAQVLSRRVWDILTLLPTNPTLLEGFQRLGADSDKSSTDNSQLENLLNTSSPQKLMYSLYIVEALTRPTYTKNLVNQSINRVVEGPNNNWSEIFIQKNGLKHLFDIFMSGTLQNGSEWHQDCLAHLLKLLCQLGVPLEDRHSLELFDSFGIATLLPNITKSKRRRCNKQEKLVIPCLNQTMLDLMDINTVMPRFNSILMEMASPRDLTHYKTGFWGRAQVVHFAMALLVSWSNSNPQVSRALVMSKNASGWLSRLVLEDPDPTVRREISTALFRLCTTNQDIVEVLFTTLNSFMDKAERMRPQRHETFQHPQEEGKEPYGPTCRDYFWLLCRLVDLLPDELKESSNSSSLDLTEFTNTAWRLIAHRECVERRHTPIEDDGLVGLLSFMCNLLKYDKIFKELGLEAVDDIFEYLFALPDATNRHLPKCKSQSSRSAAYDLLVELVKSCTENYKHLHAKVLAQHKPGPFGPYPWDYWPHEDGRSECGFVGLTNLGATCYMASCMQHLYMMPEARNSILKANYIENAKHSQILKELQKMFAYLLESERKTYSPRSFCKVYTMDHQPLNTAEQKDMAEFFIDLVSKLEEMTPELKELVKNLFGGIISNNVVSLDCSHVSCTLEEFYTVRCQVADMRSLIESLNEVTVKDTLEGDNMYTCSQCGKKVRAEKRACFKKLPKILCFNTMRYTFNMVTMTKEKVNTHFSFPMRLDMSEYVEKHLIPQKSNELEQNPNDTEENYEYELIGVTVHTGTADGGHYYSFIRDRSYTVKRDKWFLFNDAEVKPFDPNQIPAECFGGEMTSKTYDSVTDKFMDLSFEKTNSAYMLFYERVNKDETKEQAWCSSEGGSKEESSECFEEPSSLVPDIKLNKELEDWIWQDNRQFLQDENIFEHTYFQFLWQICGFIPQTLENPQEMTEMAAQLTTTFFLETFIHSKEKPTMVQWVELLTKQFNMSQNACEWFLQHMAVDNWWPVQILIKCPNQMVRQMFQRLCIHVIQRLKSAHQALYLKTDFCDENDDVTNIDSEKVGCLSCVTMFIRMLLSLLEHSAKAHWKNLSEYFTLLNEFCKMGDQESQFLLSINTIYSMANFYLGQKPTDLMEMIAEEDEEDELLAIASERSKPTSLEKMITLIATLVEKARGQDHTLKLTALDHHIIAGGKGFLFLIQQIKDNINLHQTRNLIYSLCRWNDPLANQIVTVIFNTIQKLSSNPDTCQPFYRILTLLCEMNGSSGLPCFTQLILRRVWDVADISPYAVLDWLSLQVPRNKIISSSVLSDVDTWLERFLMAHNNQRVRSAAAYLLIQLVPCPQFRQGYRINRVLCSPQKDLNMTPESRKVLHQVYTALLNHLKAAKTYVDVSTHSTAKLTAYFSILNYCTISRTEKLLFGPYLNDLWHIFYPKLSEPGIPVNQNKQALLIYWNTVLSDCPENVQLMLQNSNIVKNLPFNYILADNDDQEVIMFNRFMLPAYYGILRYMCLHSRNFTRQLANHQNMAWAFKNISMYPTQYPMTVDELFKLMQLFVKTYPDSTEQELVEIRMFRKQTLQLYTQVLDPRSGWGTLIPAVKLLVESDEDRLCFIFNGGLHMCFQAFQLLHNMYHEATACHVYTEIVDLLTIINEFLKCLREFRNEKEVQKYLLACKDWSEIIKKLFTLLNTYSCPEMRSVVLDILREMVTLLPNDVINVMVPFLSQYHGVCEDSNVSPVSTNTAIGPYFPRRGHKMPSMMPKNSARPIRPIIQMAVNVNLIEVSKGVDPEYDKAITAFYSPYHNMVNAVCRLAVEHDCLAEQAIALSAKLGLEGATLHFAIFPKFWTDLYQSQTQMRDSSSSGKDYVGMLVQNRLFTEYVETVLLEERVSLVNYTIYQCIGTFLPKVASTVLTEQNIKMMQNVITLMDTDSNVDNNPVQTTGTLRALTLVFDQVSPPAELQPKLNALIEKANAATMMNPKEDLNVDDDDDLEEDEEEEVSDEEEEINDVVDDDDDDDDEEEDEEEDDEDALRRIVNQEGQAGVKILGLKKNKESKHRSSQQ
ncbi:ubiquitin carboxyl-terminal hydrolase puf isoform X2 [Planococcus citri]|uniref:ubiquitin carboxyl-terminal hydrolase puf isoform X2 n=1 Tax=Planococcus citri TaxID=170843 RepID=UPI0031F7758F